MASQDQQMESRDVYRPQPVPADVAPLDSGFRWRSDLIDYSRHEAYADLVKKTGFAERVGALATYSRFFLLLAAKRILRYEMIPTEFREGRSLKDRAGFVTSALRNAIGFSRVATRRRAMAATDFDAKLDAQGIAVVAMPQARVAELRELAGPFFERLSARRGKGANRRAFDESRATTGRQAAPELYALLEAIFAESGLTAAAERYMGRKVRLVDVNPQINDPSDSFWRDVFEDMPGKTLPQTAYFHRDASGGDLKIIIYCSDVGPQNGPFSYTVGSNNMTISAVDNLLCEANDHNGFSLTTVEARAKFAALPAKLRQKGLFGNDLDDNAAESRKIVDAMWQVTGAEGSMVMFDTKGIHRGGMVEQGERRVITCVLG